MEGAPADSVSPLNTGLHPFVRPVDTGELGRPVFLGDAFPWIHCVRLGTPFLHVLFFKPVDFRGDNADTWRAPQRIRGPILFFLSDAWLPPSFQPSFLGRLLTSLLPVKGALAIFNWAFTLSAASFLSLRHCCTGTGRSPFHAWVLVDSVRERRRIRPVERGRLERNRLFSDGKKNCLPSTGLRGPTFGRVRSRQRCFHAALRRRRREVPGVGRNWPESKITCPVQTSPAWSELPSAPVFLQMTTAP